MPTTGTYGEADQGGQTWGPGSGVGDYAGFQWVAPATGTVTTVRIPWKSTTSVSGTTKVQLWSNTAGSPGAQIGADSSTENYTSGVNADETYTFASPPAIVNGTTYWIIVHAVTGSGDHVIGNCTQVAGYGSTRNSTITSMTDDGIGASRDWRVEITYTPAASSSPPFKRPTRFFRRSF